MSLAGFAQLQTVENRLVAPLVDDINPTWVLEIAPVTSSSPALGCERERLLADAGGISWPFSAAIDALPLDADSVPLVLVRHLWQPGFDADPLADIVRVLKPGGTLISVTANPWHRKSWQVLGRDALWLPSWPRWQLLHARGELESCMKSSLRWKSLVPGVSPVLILVAQKPRRPATVKRVQFGRPVFGGAAAAVSQYRAA